MKRLVMIGALVLLLLAVALPASARGLTPERLENAGWSCLTADSETHCWKGDPGALGEFIVGGVGTVNIMVFEHGDFVAAETVTWNDASQRACPGEGLGHNDGWGFAPFGAYACHHYPASG